MLRYYAKVPALIKPIKLGRVRTLLLTKPFLLQPIKTEVKL